MKIKVYEGGYKPERAHGNDAGADLFAPERVVLRAHDDCEIDTKVAMQIPAGYFGKLESKSGLLRRDKILCPGGVIDSGYTGTIVVILENHGSKDHVFEAGDKICQIVIHPCLLCTFEEADSLEVTERGTNGFGSSGK